MLLRPGADGVQLLYELRFPPGYTGERKAAAQATAVVSTDFPVRDAFPLRGGELTVTASRDVYEALMWAKILGGGQLPFPPVEPQVERYRGRSLRR